MILHLPDVGRVDSNKMTFQIKTGSIRPSQSRNITNVIKSLQYKPSEWKEDQMKSHTQLAEKNNTEAKDWGSEVQV